MDSEVKEIFTEITKIFLCDSCEMSCGIKISCRQVDRKVEELPVEEIMKTIKEQIMELKINDKIAVVSILNPDIKGIVETINFLEEKATIKITTGKGGRLEVPFDRIRKK